MVAHTQHHASVLFVVFCVHMYSFASSIRPMPPPTFSDTAITDRHSDTTTFHLRAHWAQISWSSRSEKNLWTSALDGSRTFDFLRERKTPYPLGQVLSLSAQSTTLAHIYNVCCIHEQETKDGLFSILLHMTLYNINLSNNIFFFFDTLVKQD